MYKKNSNVKPESYSVIELHLDCNIFCRTMFENPLEKEALGREIIREINELKARDSFYRAKLSGITVCFENMDSVTDSLGYCLRHSQGKL